MKKVAEGLDSEHRKLVLSKVSGILPNMPYFYGVPKVHKPGCPLRPIVATCGSPSSSLAKWLADCLSPYLGLFSDAHLMHSIDFIEKLKMNSLPGRMVSFDVNALFTNVPLDDVLAFLERKYNDGTFNPPLPISPFLSFKVMC